MSSVKSRIAQLPNYLGVKKGLFFDSIEVASSGYRGDGLSNSVSSDVLVRIMTIYPAVNIRWILMNEGQPINSPNESIRTDVKISGEISGIGVAVSNGGSNSYQSLPCDNANLDIGNFNLLSTLIKSKDAQITLLAEALSVAQESIRNLSRLSLSKDIHGTD